jgi:hypothetical protein
MKMAIYLMVREHFKDVYTLIDRDVADLQMTIKGFFVVSSLSNYESKAEPYFL